MRPSGGWDTVLGKRIRESLTLRIFLVTCLLLFVSCAVTYGVIALATPITYSSIVTADFERQAAGLPSRLEQTTREDSGGVIDRFIRDTGARVMVVDQNGSIIETSSNLSVSLIYTTEDTVTACEGDSISSDIAITAAFGQESDTGDVSITTEGFSYPFAFQGDTETSFVLIAPPLRRENRTVQALGEIAPLLLGLMLVFSSGCAMFYSRYITRPIIRLSGISRRMAELDFSWQCGDPRQDEIGVLGRSLDELSRRLSGALAELKDANAALQRDIDRERELERQRLAFFSAASHELKTPVTILKGQLAGMLEGVDVYRDRDKYLAKSLRVAGRMEVLIQEILTVSRMESGGFAPRWEEIDLADLVRRQLALYDELIRRKALEAAVSLPGGLTLRGDPALLRKVLDNVLSNAVFYAPDGAALSVAAEPGPGGPVLTVENGGVHIPEEVLPHVFEPFSRADASRNRRTGGSGLGLYIVGMILDRHGAAYRIENTAEGVRFTIRFA